MSKKEGRFASVYKKTSQEFKDRGKNFDPQKPGWVQKEVDALAKAGSGRTTSPVGTEAFTGKDTAVDGTAHVTKKGKVVEK